MGAFSRCRQAEVPWSGRGSTRAQRCHTDRRRAPPGTIFPRLKSARCSPSRRQRFARASTHHSRGLFRSIKGRSSLALSGIFAFEGTIDCDYRGEICVILYNTRDAVFSIGSGQRIAQMVFVPYAELDFEEVYELDLTVRGDGGFGSTDTEMQPVAQQLASNGKNHDRSLSNASAAV